MAWETEIEDYGAGYYMTLAPLVAAGKVMVGVSGGEFGIRGFVAALDAKTGELAWKTYTIPAPGEAGSESWPGDTWKTGGVPVWITVNGRQYVAVLSGWGVDAERQQQSLRILGRTSLTVPQGGVLWVFGLEDDE